MTWIFVLAAAFAISVNVQSSHAQFVGAVLAGGVIGLISGYIGFTLRLDTYASSAELAGAMTGRVVGDSLLCALAVWLYRKAK